MRNPVYQYTVTYTGWVAGGPDAGQPVRSKQLFTDRIKALTFFRKQYNLKGRYGHKEPVIDMATVCVPINVEEAMAELEEYELTINNGDGI